MTDGPLPPYPPPGAPPPDEPSPATQFPPPGAVPAPAVPAPYPGGGLPGRPAPGLMLGAAHKPGAFALRPLNLGSIYDGAFRIIRFNPKATVGAAVLVTSAAMVLPVLITAVLTFTVGLAVDASGEIDPGADTGEVLALLAAYGSLLLSLVLAQVGITFVTGMVTHVTRAAAVGRQLNLAQAWAATAGKRWRLLGLTLLLNVGLLALLILYVVAWVVVVALSPSPWPVLLWGLVTVPAFLALCCWGWIRVYYLPVPPLMLEDIGVFDAIGRGWHLTSRHFWRTFGIALLTAIIASFAGGILSMPVSIISQVAGIAIPEYSALLLVVGQAVAIIVQYAFVAPFIATVSSMQYVDLRIRKEAFDIELMREAGIIPP